MAIAFALSTLTAGCPETATPTPGPGPDLAETVDAGPDTAEVQNKVDADTSKVCTPGVLSCADPVTAATCNAEGSGYDTTACDTGLTCWPDSGKCKLPNCEPTSQECRSVDTYRVCDDNGIQWGDTLPCPADTFCDGGACVGCNAGAFECTSNLNFRSCPDGSGWTEPAACGDDMACVDDQCCNFTGFCNSDGAAVRLCATGDGTVILDEVSPCAVPAQCFEGNCVSCVPGETQCSGDTGYQECATDGLSFGEVLPCAGDKVCIGGACTADGCLPRVLLVVDRSGSMSSDWGDVAASITALSTSNPGYYGLIAFPGNFGDSCDVDDALSVPMGLNNSLELQNWMATHDPTGATPLLAVMEKLSWLAPTALQGNPGTIVILSDGDDSCGSGNIANQLGPIAATLFSQYQIVTYAIGYGYSGTGSSTELNALTANGGTTATKHIVAGDESSLTDAFQGIIDDIKYCD